MAAFVAGSMLTTCAVLRVLDGSMSGEWVFSALWPRVLFASCVAAAVEVLPLSTNYDNLTIPAAAYAALALCGMRT